MITPQQLPYDHLMDSIEEGVWNPSAICKSHGVRLGEGISMLSWCTGRAEDESATSGNFGLIQHAISELFGTGIPRLKQDMNAFAGFGRYHNDFWRCFVDRCIFWIISYIHAYLSTAPGSDFICETFITSNCLAYSDPDHLYRFPRLCMPLLRSISRQ